MQRDQRGFSRLWIHARWRCRAWWRWRPVYRRIIHGDVVLLTDVPDSVREGHTLGLHQELHGTALLLADETLVCVTSWSTK